MFISSFFVYFTSLLKHVAPAALLPSVLKTKLKSE